MSVNSNATDHHSVIEYEEIRYRIIRRRIVHLSLSTLKYINNLPLARTLFITISHFQPWALLSRKFERSHPTEDSLNQALDLLLHGQKFQNIYITYNYLL